KFAKFDFFSIPDRKRVSYHCFFHYSFYNTIIDSRNGVIIFSRRMRIKASIVRYQHIRRMYEIQWFHRKKSTNVF
ncbi:MAG: hypothetical protein D6785_01145, partial [Planctomycetota bacterium]